MCLLAHCFLLEIIKIIIKIFKQDVHFNATYITINLYSVIIKWLQPYNYHHHIDIVRIHPRSMFLGAESTLLFAKNWSHIVSKNWIIISVWKVKWLLASLFSITPLVIYPSYTMLFSVTCIFSALFQPWLRNKIRRNWNLLQNLPLPNKRRTHERKMLLLSMMNLKRNQGVVAVSVLSKF